MQLTDELAELIAHAGPKVLDNADSFRAALDDFLTPDAASRGVINLLVDAVRQGSVDRLLRDISHGGDPEQAVAVCGDQLARDRATSETASSRWALAVLGFAAGVVDRETLEKYDAHAPASSSSASPEVAAPVVAAPVVEAAPVVAPELGAVLPSAKAAPTEIPASAMPPQTPSLTGAPTEVAPVASQLAPARERKARRTGALLVPLGVAGVVLAGSLTAAIVLRPGDGDGDGDDTGTNPKKTDTTSAAAFDPAAFEQTLRATVSPIMDADSARVTATTWSSSDVANGVPVRLTGDARASATRWRITGKKGGHTITVSVNWWPKDMGDIASPCTYSADAIISPPLDSELDGKLLPGTSSLSGSSSCDDATTYWGSNSRSAIYGAWGLTQVHSISSGDGLSEPMVRITEEWYEPDLSTYDHTAMGYSAAGNNDLARANARLTKAQMLKVSRNAALALPKPTSLPGTPSYYACRFSPKTPAACPDTIKKAPVS